MVDAADDKVGSASSTELIDSQFDTVDGGAVGRPYLDFAHIVAARQAQGDSGREGAGKARARRVGRADDNLAHIANHLDKRTNTHGIEAVIIGYQYQWFINTHYFSLFFRYKSTKKGARIRLYHIKYVSLQSK